MTEQQGIETRADHFWQELKLIDGPVRWLYWAIGLFSVWYHWQGELSTGAVTGLVLYLGLNVVVTPIMPRANLAMRRYLAVGFYAVDLLFTSFLIYHTGGLVSQLFLLYCLLIFKAAIYYPYVHPIILVPFLIFPLYMVTLYLGTGTLVFMKDQLFVLRYTLLLVVILAGLYTAWHLDNRHRHTRHLLEQLEVEHRRISERRRELRAILDSIADGVIVVDPELRLLMINPVAADLFNLTYPQPPETFLGELLDNPPLLTLLRRAFEDPAGKDVLICDEIEAHPISSARSVVCEALATALVSGHDVPHGAVVVLRDKTRQKELEESKTNFISMLSHELRTPLTAIRGFVDLILTGDTGDISSEQREYLNIALDQSEQLGGLINALLEFAEMETAETRLDLRSFSLNKLVQKVLDRLEPLASQREITLQLHLPPDLAPLCADSERLEHVFVNLLDNAIKFTPEGGQIKVSANDQGPELVVCVTDTGPGVPPAEKDRIFERFYQIDNSSTREHRGTGLGLAICKHIVELHGGRIWVEPPDEGMVGKNGPGSCFCFTIPRDLTQRTSPAAKLAQDERYIASRTSSAED